MHPRDVKRQLVNLVDRRGVLDRAIRKIKDACTHDGSLVKCGDDFQWCKACKRHLKRKT